jgi:hypothetical protein
VKGDSTPAAPKRYVIGLADNVRERHALFHIFPGAHNKIGCFRINHVHNLIEFDRMVKYDMPDFLFIPGWLSQYTDWKQMCDMIIEARTWPRLVLITSMDNGRAGEIMRYMNRHCPDIVIAHSPWNNEGWAMNRIQDREYYYVD